MILVDGALEARQRAGRPVRVGMVGAGFMGRGVAAQIIRCTPGMELVAISNRHLDGARRAYKEAGVEHVRVVEDATGLDRAVGNGVPAATEDAAALCAAESVDVICDVTGAVELSGRHAGRLRARQARRDDVRRARRHGRPAAQGPGRRGGRRLQWRRRGSARGAT